MRCESIQKQLSAYLDGELSRREEARIAEHLERCPECAREYEQLVQVAQAFRDFHPEPPPDLWRGIEARLEPRGHSRRSWEFSWLRVGWRPLAAVALLMLLLGGIWWINRPEEQVPLDHYLAAHIGYADEDSIGAGSLAMYLFPSTHEEENLWSEETDQLLERYFQEN